MPVNIVADANIPFVQQCFSELGSVRQMPGRQITNQMLQKADVLLVRSVTQVNSQLLEGTPVRFVGTATIGFEHVDIAFLKDRGIAFASAPGSNANSVAEYVIAALLEVAAKKGLQLAGMSVGVIGVGHVGSLVAAKCAALGMQTVLNDPPLVRATGDPVFRPLDQALECDVVTLHVPLTFEGSDPTYHLADRSFFQAIRSGAVFINTSRGAVHDTLALKHAIRSGRLGAVVLDVWEGEPWIDPQLLDMTDIATPHIAGYSLDGKISGMIMIYQRLCEFLGERPVHGVWDFLPPPSVPTIRLAGNTTEQDLIRQTVARVYPIMEDDQRTRGLLGIDQAGRGEMFDQLRRDYPQRREFHNTTVYLPAGERSLAAKLSGIGFGVRFDE